MDRATLVAFGQCGVLCERNKGKVFWSSIPEPLTMCCVLMPSTVVRQGAGAWRTVGWVNRQAVSNGTGLDSNQAAKGGWLFPTDTTCHYAWASIRFGFWLLFKRCLQCSADSLDRWGRPVFRKVVPREKTSVMLRADTLLWWKAGKNSSVSRYS